ncbi:MAG: spermidine synthase [Paraglaciecola sp.]|jgi:spermidine synthase
MDLFDMPDDQTSLPKQQSVQKQYATLIYAAFIAGLCSIIYELLIATTVSYFMGDSVKFFSLTIGLYMAAMGVGSYVSKFITGKLLQRFVIAEILLGIIGGISIPLLYFTYTTTALFYPTYVALTLCIGFLIGLEIPFLTRLMENYQVLKSNIANILSFDYLGALIATIAFPFFLLPVMGIYQSSLLFGLINMSIAAVVLYSYRKSLGKTGKKLQLLTAAMSLAILIMLVFSSQALKHWDQMLYNGRIVHSEQTPYQKITLTKSKNDLRLYLNGVLQFSSVDEYRYHESLVMVPMTYANKPIKRVLVLGAGDGLAVRELLKYPEIVQIVLVDLDPRMTELAKHNAHLIDLNLASLDNKKVQVVIDDAFVFLEKNKQTFDLIINDLPDPNTIALSRLYSKQYYRLARANLTSGGIMVTQATSPFFVKPAFWSIAKTIEAAGFDYVYPYHTNVPSFGDWGFVLSGLQPITLVAKRPVENSQFLTHDTMSTMFLFAKDIQEIDVEINQIDKPVVLDYYLNSWRYFSD